MGAAASVKVGDTAQSGSSAAANLLWDKVKDNATGVDESTLKAIADDSQEDSALEKAEMAKAQSKKAKLAWQSASGKIAAVTAFKEKVPDDDDVKACKADVEAVEKEAASLGGVFAASLFAAKLKDDAEEEDAPPPSVKTLGTAALFVQALQGDDSDDEEDEEAVSKWAGLAGAIQFADKLGLDKPALEKEAEQLKAKADEATEKKKAKSALASKLASARSKLSMVVMLADADDDERESLIQTAQAEEEDTKAADEKATAAAAVFEERTSKWIKARGALTALSAMKPEVKEPVEAGLVASKLGKLRLAGMAALATTKDAEEETEEETSKARAAMGAALFIAKLKKEPKPLKVSFNEVGKEVSDSLKVVNALRSEVEAKKPAKAKLAGVAFAALLGAKLGAGDNAELKAEQTAATAETDECEGKEDELNAAKAKLQAARGKLAIVKALASAAKTSPPPSDEDEKLTLGGAVLSMKFVNKLKKSQEDEGKTASLKVAGLAAMMASRKKAEVSLAGAAGAAVFLARLKN